MSVLFLLSIASNFPAGSNDIVRSTIHRVRAPPHLPIDGMTPERYSIPYVSTKNVFMSQLADILPSSVVP